jgi:hypothetical protein
MSAQGNAAGAPDAEPRALRPALRYFMLTACVVAATSSWA